MDSHPPITTCPPAGSEVENKLWALSPGLPTLDLRGRKQNRMIGSRRHRSNRETR